jgi:hypothetical protein
MHSQALNISIGYVGVEGMIAINDKLPLQVQVKLQEKRLEFLQKMDEAIQRHTQGRPMYGLECCYGGAPQITGSQEIARPKRAPSPPASFIIQRICKIPRNKLGETDVQALIKAFRPTEQCAQQDQEGLTPPSLSRVKFGYRSEFIHSIIITYLHQNDQNPTYFLLANRYTAHSYSSRNHTSFHKP